MTVFSKIVSSVALTALVATPALADKASQLADINGALGRDAESALESRGFAHISTHKSDSGFVNSYWWDAQAKDCVTVEIYDGRVMTINDATPRDCGRTSGNGDAAAAVGVVAGAAILGALLSHKSHHHENDKHAADLQAEQQYERGYKDGLHNSSYHNYEKSDAYSTGYTAGVDERNANVSHHSGRGGYQSYAQINDLNGARAAGGMDQLERRGFRQVDNFETGTTRYSIQWQPQSRQCVQVTIADGKFYDVREIGQHPKCR